MPHRAPCLDVLRLHHGYAQKVGLELHDKVVARSSPVHRKCLYLHARIALHGAQYVKALVRHRLARGTHERGAVARARQTAN